MHHTCRAYSLYIDFSNGAYVAIYIKHMLYTCLMQRSTYFYFSFISVFFSIINRILQKKGARRVSSLYIDFSNGDAYFTFFKLALAIVFNCLWTLISSRKTYVKQEKRRGDKGDIPP
jgi:hypothetical protein